MSEILRTTAAVAGLLVASYLVLMILWFLSLFAYQTTQRVLVEIDQGASCLIWGSGSRREL